MTGPRATYYCLSCKRMKLKYYKPFQRGLCFECARYHRAQGTFEDIANPPKDISKKYGKRKNAGGYVYVRTEDDRVGLEHRILVGDSIGRRLRSHETVHHINGIRDDNRLENLELWPGPHGRGQRLDDLLDYVADFWADEIIQKIEERRGGSLKA